MMIEWPRDVVRRRISMLVAGHNGAEGETRYGQKSNRSLGEIQIEHRYLTVPPALSPHTLPLTHTTDSHVCLRRDWYDFRMDTLTLVLILDVPFDVT